MLDKHSESMRSFLTHAGMCLIKKSNRSEDSRLELDEEIIRTNRLIKLLCQHGPLQPRRCADLMNEKYGYDLGRMEIIEMFKGFRISQDERPDMLSWADDLGRLFMRTLETGKVEDYDAFLLKRDEPISKRRNKHLDIQNRFACLKLCVLIPELGKTEQGEVVEKFGQVFAKYYLYDISDGLAEYCNAGKNHHAKAAKAGRASEDETGKRKIAQLEKALERSDMMLRDLQDEFDQRLEESKIKELVDFFSRLNSDKYGRILDELLNIRRGVSLLKKQRYELPPEIGGLLILTQKLTQFVRDSGINPIMKPQEVKQVKATDIEFCDYEGKPFATKDEAKAIKVISPGWIYTDKDLQIARPKVKEVVGNE
ncbi:MAG: hypothetical protein IJ849_10490 [Selenomonadaceae bacterium]|nr:hypothetical protein [Selenomonadaceae bacterium]